MQACSTSMEGASGAPASAGTDFTPLVNTLALYFQIRDDYVNLASHAYMKHKSFCEDITEGKFSFPVIHCIHADPADRRLVSILRQRTKDVELKLHAVQRLHETKSLAYTRAELDRLKVRATEEIAALGGHADLQALVELLHSQLGDGEGAPGLAASAEDEQRRQAGGSAGSPLGSPVPALPIGELSHGEVPPQLGLERMHSLS